MLYENKTAKLLIDEFIIIINQEQNNLKEEYVKNILNIYDLLLQQQEGKTYNDYKNGNINIKKLEQEVKKDRKYKKRNLQDQIKIMINPLLYWIELYEINNQIDLSKYKQEILVK